MRSRLDLQVAVLATLLSSTAPLLANGRFPRGERWLQNPKAPQHWVLSATYGLLTTKNAGADWDYVCESGFAELGTEADPVVAFNGAGRLVVSLASNFSVGSDDQCDFEPTLGQGKYVAVPDFTSVATRPSELLAAVVSTDAGVNPVNQLYRSADGGQSWSKLGSPLAPELALVTTLDVAPSDPQRVYVSGLGADGEGLLLRSDDAGESFEQLQLPTDSVNGEAPYIAAVSADDADRLYVRTDAWFFDASDGLSRAGDALLYSDDGGRSFQRLFSAGGKLFGFALSPAGDELLIAYGDPLEGGGRVVDTSALGIYRAPAGSAQFKQVFGASVSCLSWTEDGVYVCTSQGELGFALARTTELDLRGAEYPLFEPLLRLPDVRGPLACPACSSVSRCAEAWYGACVSWNRDDCEAPSAAPADGADCAEGGAEQPTQGEAGTEAGGAPSSSESGAGGDSAAGSGVRPISEPQPRKSASGGCGCRLAQPAPGVFGAGALAALLVGCLRRRARREGLGTSAKA